MVQSLPVLVALEKGSVEYHPGGRAQRAGCSKAMLIPQPNSPPQQRVCGVLPPREGEEVSEFAGALVGVFA